jgi:hypothetical protein
MNQISIVTTFEDSLMYNVDFRLRILGTKFTREEFEEAINKNRLKAEETSEQIYILNKEELQLESKLKFYGVINQLLNLLTFLSGGFVIYYWIKSH